MSDFYLADEARIELARRIAREAIILLENEDHVLPLEKGRTIALLGRTQNDTIIGGSGSGASQSGRTLQIRDELERAGLVPAPSVDAFYKKVREDELAASKEQMKQQGDMLSSLEGLVASGAIYEIFGRYNAPTPEPEVPAEALDAAAQLTDTAILIIGRASGGEECDRRVEGDYELMESEVALIAAAREHFRKVIVVYDVNGAVDTNWMRHVPEVKAAVYMGTAGEQAAGALADILTGVVSPSGKLTQTLARSYDDYPTAKNFSYNKDNPSNIRTYADYGLDAAANGSVGHDVSPVTLYQEDIYLGYRYFDSFSADVMYPFGHGLSYAEFTYHCDDMSFWEGDLVVTATVKNISEKFSGKAVAEVYVSAPDGRLKKAYRELRTFGKTGNLAPGISETLVMTCPLTDLASFDEADSCYVIEAGDYIVSIGGSSRDLADCAVIHVDSDIVTREVTADIGINPANRGKIDFMTPPDAPEEEDLVDDDDFFGGFTEEEMVPVLHLAKTDVTTDWPVERKYDFSVPAAEGATLRDVADGRVSMEAFINQMSEDELVVLATGYGPGLPFGGIAAKGAPSTLDYPDGTPIGANDHPGSMNGYISPALAKYGIPSCEYKDGPATVGKVAWPTDLAIASTWSDELAREFGDAIGTECEELTVDSWLAPGMDLIRNPIGGRNFEYFSEDPIITGRFAVGISRGAMDNNAVTSCPKHFALNEQETYRRGKALKNIDAADSIVTARAARELYLKPFEMVATLAEPTTFMTSFNKINGTFAGGNHALNTEILRGEWGYDGVVVTDWGDMDCVVDGADAVAAGNDVVMPGGPPVMAQIKAGLTEGRVTMLDLKVAAAHLMNFVMHSKSFLAK